MNTEQTKGGPAETAPLSIRQISKIEDWLMSEASARLTEAQRIAFRQAMTKEFRALNAEAGARSAVSYYQALACTHIVDLAVLEPYLAQLRATQDDVGCPTAAGSMGDENRSLVALVISAEALEALDVRRFSFDKLADASLRLRGAAASTPESRQQDAESVIRAMSSVKPKTS